MSLKRSIVGDIDARILPGLLAWYRAETMREHFGDGEDLLYLFDESGNGKNMSSAEGGANKPPAFTSSGPNGYASLLLDGVDDELRGNFAIGTVVKGGFAVVKGDTAGTWGTTNAGFIGGLTAGDFYIAGKANSTLIEMVGTTNSTLYVNGVETDDVVTTNKWNLVYGTYDTAQPITSQSELGRVSAGATWFGGEIAECGMFTGTPTASQLTLFADALMDKYNIT